MLTWWLLLLLSMCVCFVTGDVGVKLRVSDAGEVSVEVTA